MNHASSRDEPGGDTRAAEASPDTSYSKTLPRIPSSIGTAGYRTQRQRQNRVVTGGELAHGMDDLVQLNRRIAKHWLGNLDAGQEEYLRYVSVCLGQFTHSPAELTGVLTFAKQLHLNALSVARLNRQYLRFARLASKDVAAGKFEMLIRLGITLEQAELLGNLTNPELNRLAFGWNGPIVDFAAQPFRRGAALHVRAARHHATAFVAIRLAS
jgi:hypothetical protein